MKNRSLKIEELGDFQAQRTHPGIRLKGKWLVGFGFLPGQRVEVLPGAAIGELTLRVVSTLNPAIHAA